MVSREFYTQSSHTKTKNSFLKLKTFFSLLKLFGKGKRKKHGIAAV